MGVKCDCKCESLALSELEVSVGRGHKGWCRECM
jgi:hypothetical protein